MREEAVGPARENQYTDTKVKTEPWFVSIDLDLGTRRDLTFVIRPRVVIGPVMKLFVNPS